MHCSHPIAYTCKRGREENVEEKCYLFQHTPQSLVGVLIKRVEVVSYSATKQNWVLHIHTQ